MPVAEPPSIELPSDIETLQRMVQQLLEENADLASQLEWFKRHVFGRRSEKLDSNQLALFEELAQKLQDAQQAARSPTPPSDKGQSGHGRKALPDHLPRERIEYHPAEDRRICPDCQEAMSPIGEEVTEELDYVPASLVVRQHVRFKYACKHCQQHVVIAEPPARAIDKGRPGPGLLAHVLTSKYADHLPLNRQEGILKRHGVDIARSTMCDWVRDSAALLSPIVEHMKQSVLNSRKIHTDDTSVPVQEKGRNQTRKSYLWVYIGDDEDVVFDYTPSRSREGPLNFLGDYAGYVQADAYSGYDEFFNNSAATEVGCWAHVRRKFYDAQTTDRRRSTEMIALIGRLYNVEHNAGEDPQARQKLRQEKCPAILEEIKQRLDKWSREVLPKSPIGQAVSYARTQWTALTRYVDDGILDIDNNVAERALRAVVIGRKNWLFAGSDAGGQRAAIIYSLVATCKMHKIDPFAYLRDVIERVSTHPASNIDALTPRGWKAAQTAGPTN